MDNILIKSKTQKILILIALLAALSVLIILGYKLLVKKDFRISNLNNEVVEVKTKYKKTTPEVCYGSIFSCKKVKVKEQGTVNQNKIGKYEITYTATYKNKTKTYKKQVEVKDSTKPEIIIKTSKLVVCPNGNPLNTTIKAIDNYDGDITKNIEITKNGNMYTYTSKDSSGNTSKITKQAQIADNRKPIIKLIGKQEELVVVNKPYKEQGATAQDVCDGDITDKIITTGNVNTNKKGTYKITYEVTDKQNNTTKVERIIKVVDQNQIITPNGKIIYLTFDDGPGKYTEKLLNILKKYNIKATFFVTKNVKNYPDILKREYKEGHTVGLHTWSHNYSIYKNEKTYFNDLYKIENEVYKITGYKANIIRFPGGSSNTISKNYKKGIMTKITKEVEQRGYIYFDWNVYSGDAGETQNPNKVAKNVIKTLNQGKTNVVLQHDIHKYSVDAVEKIIKYGIQKGYSFAPITKDTPLIHHRVNN